MAELGAAQTEQANICNKEQAQVQRVNSKNIISIINSNVFMYRHIILYTTHSMAASVHHWHDTKPTVSVYC